jgi:hypothetical protein
MTKYEYMTASNQLGDDEKDMERQLNSLGTAGWELVTMFVRAGLTITWILKRPLQKGGEKWQKTDGRKEWRKRRTAA